MTHQARRTFDAYGSIFRSALFPAWERLVRRRPTLDYLEDLTRTQWWSLDRLRERQVEELRRLLRHAHAHVPVFRERMDLAGVSPETIRAPEDLAKLPLFTRADAIAAGDRWASTVEPRAVLRKSTGGTTGQPLSFGYDLGSEYWRQAIKLRGYRWAGYLPGDKTLHFWGHPMTPLRAWPARTKVALDRFLRRDHYLDCTRSDFGAAIDFIRDERPQLIVCYTLAGAALARHIVAGGLRAWGDIPVICAAEKLYARDRRVLEEAFGPLVFDTYGCREVMLVGAECDAHDGLHLSMENVMVEVVVRDGERERPAAPGEEGDVVLTDLHNYGMPFIRYVNGDRAVMKSPGPCTCGRELLRLASVEGRCSDLLRDKAGNAVSGILFSVMFSYPPLSERVRAWRAVQHRSGAVTVNLVVGRGFTDGDLDQVRQSAAERLGLPVDVRKVDSIPPGDNGKHRLVVVEA